MSLFFMKGQRVRWSAEGREAFPFKADRVGVVLGRSRDDKLRYVLWDGLNSKTGLHTDYLEPVATDAGLMRPWPDDANH